MTLKATAIDVRFVSEEDRLALTLRSDDDSLEMHVTRRMTRAVMLAMVELLMRSSREIGAAPAGNRTDVLLFEHMEAAAGWQRVEGSAQPGGLSDASQTATVDIGGVRQTAAGAALLTKTDVTVRDGNMQLHFHDREGARAEIELPRDKAHQFLSILREKSVQAQWDIQELSWMDRRSQVVIPEGVRLS
ncbi:hypothetical protein CHU95_21820 [Niveispirillum lacus]|uniref:Uncharacterized protein n=1 Tax=Niveispirillum lacus TaxID=1981099 RepID=A0A255YRC4_9PROT|nr:hypothetical protein [Niveispirillum lacus]OYQ31768.1 hypothetical protein CHU95_21820 [Niveispirillum lacus]